VVLRAADDHALALAVVDLADVNLSEPGTLSLREDLGNDDAFELAADFVDILGLKAEQGQSIPPQSVSRDFSSARP
jgi:hypothetical protein